MAKKPAKKKAASAKPKGKKSAGKKRQSRGKTKPKKQQGKPQPEKTKKKLNRNKGLGLYIRVKKVIWRQYKADFKGGDYRDKDGLFLKTVSKVYHECKTAGRDCPNYVILQKYAQITKGEKRPEPFISPDLYEETHPYWEIKDVEFQLFEPYLWIISPMIIAPPSEFEVSQYVDSDGTTSDGYNRYFKEWVDWCNMVYRSQHGYEVGTEEIEIHFIFTKPYWDDDKKRWETEILSVTPSGEVEDFGFVPKGTGADHSPEEHKPHKPKEKAEKPTEGKAEPTPPPSADVEKARVEEVRKTARLERLIKQKESIMEEIKMWKEIGEKKEMQEAIKRLKEINKKIEQFG